MKTNAPAYHYRSALAVNPAILIFDETTSALDNESERAVQEALLKLARERTTLVIAHRLSTVRNADRIRVLTDQGVAEQGSRDELIAASGAYARLCRRVYEGSRSRFSARTVTSDLADVRRRPPKSSSGLAQKVSTWASAI